MRSTLKEKLKDIFLEVAFIGGALAFGGIVVDQTEHDHPPSEGVQYLQSKGYTNVKGGEDGSWFNACSKNTMSREYTVTTADGKTDTRTVCFSVLGPTSPWIGK